MSNNVDAFDVGRDLMGLNKFIADAQIRHDATGTDSSIRNSEGVEVLRARVGNTTSIEDALTLSSLLRDLGAIRLGSVLLDPSKPLRHTLVGYDPDSGIPLATSMSIKKTRPRVKAWKNGDDSLVLKPGSPLSDWLLRLDVEPILTSRDPELSVIIEPEKRGLGP